MPPSGAESELTPILKEREEIEARINRTSREPDILDNVHLSLNELKAYYTINQRQARNSFRLSVFAIIVGLITVVAGIWFFYFQRANVQLTAISAIAGVVVEFIGLAYFNLYNKATTQLNELRGIG
jgi:Mg2+ and Co2+ transporter CorA